MSFAQKNINAPILLALGLLLGFTFGKAITEEYTYTDAYIQSTNDSGTIKNVFSTPKIKEAEEIIKKQYYHFNEKKKEDIEKGVISSLVGSLGDKHSSYFDVSEAKEFNDVLRGDFEGIGAVIDEDKRGIIIKKVIDTSPAKKAGLQNQDIITSVGTGSVVGMKVEDAVKKIRGPKGSKVKITFLRGLNNEEKTVEVTRDTILVPSTGEKMLTGSIGYIEVSTFGEHTNKEFQSSLQKLTASGAKGIILDFRNNGGGYLDTAVDIGSYLLDNNISVVTTRENDVKLTHTYLTKSNAYTNIKIPLVMLVNGLSASATEILAGALQDHGRAVILGEKTYGKGSVQEPFVLSDGSILKITIGHWYTPKDRGIDGLGITPDIIVKLTDSDITKLYDRQLQSGFAVMNTLIKNQGNIANTLESSKDVDFTK